MTTCPPRCRVCAVQARAIRHLATVMYPLTVVAVCVGLAL